MLGLTRYLLTSRTAASNSRVYKSTKSIFDNARKVGTRSLTDLQTSKAYYSTQPGWNIQYNHKDIEKKWQQVWNEDKTVKTFDTKSTKPKFYSLSMFPYPSGSLHIGHARVYTISDTVARVHRMAGYNVLHPMGWDAFGLPAENAAIERGILPQDWTYKNIAHMKQQLQALGCQFDWAHEVTTCGPEYYKWTQWIFLHLLKRGLAYQKESYVNWDPVDQTVLANEQVDDEGKSWRSGAIVEKKLMKQWYFKITDYADSLLNDLDTLEEWPDKVKKMQKEWIGKTKGAVLEFNVEDKNEKIKVFTTRPDTLMGCTYLVMAPEHALVSKLVPESQRHEVEQFVKQILRMNEIQRSDPSQTKTGKFLGVYAIHPVTKKKLPIYLAPYVIADYGTGSVMGVPAHDTRDHTFATHHKLEIIQVIKPANEKEPVKLPFTERGVLFNSNKYDGLTSDQATDAIAADAEKNQFGKAHTNFGLRDWLISRQRYWGAPIPIIHCESCGPVPVPEDQLPVELPVKNVQFTGKGSPLADLKEWVNVECPCCKRPAKRDTDTMDTFVDSSWYFLRYPDANNNRQVFDREIINRWMPVDIYVGGIEHAILHLLYSRFITKVLHGDKLVPTSEPFKVLRTQGMVHGKTFRQKGNGRPVPNDQVEDLGTKAVLKSTGEELDISYEKMSKSKYNGVDPISVIDQFGADTIRLFLLFKAPVDHVVEWDTQSIQGQYRWLNRIWNLIQLQKVATLLNTANTVPAVNEDQAKDLKELKRMTNECIKEVTEELKVTHQFNTAIARLMKLSNVLSSTAIRTTKEVNNTTLPNNVTLPVTPWDPASIDLAVVHSAEWTHALETLVKLLSPMAPHFTAEAWRLLRADANATELPSVNITAEPWPTFDSAALAKETVPLVIQINGKSRGSIDVPVGLSESDLQQQARDSSIGQKWLKDKKVIKVIAVPSRGLVNFVVQ